MGSKPTKIDDRDVPAHNPVVNNDFIKLHYFKERKDANETQIRQENHFVVINKNGVVDEGKTLVGLRKDDHKDRIYFIKRKPNRYAGVRISNLNQSQRHSEAMSGAESEKLESSVNESSRLSGF